MLATLRQRNFALLWFGGLISMAGDWMLRIALPVHVFNLTGSTLATGTMFMAGMLPNLLFGSVAGVFVDRWDRKQTMVMTNLVLAFSILPLAQVDSREWLWVVYLVAFVQSLVGQFFGPAENALLPSLVDEQHLLAANALNALNNNLARLIGPALGGLTAALLGLTGVAVVDAGTYLVAAAMIALIRSPSSPGVEQPLSQSVAPISLIAVWREWLAGLRMVRTVPLLALLFGVTAIVAVGEGVIAVLFVPFVTDVLGGEALGLGWLMSAQAVGGLAGGVVVAKIGQTIPPARMLAPSAILFGLIDLVIFNYSSFYPGFTIAVVLFVLVGLPGAGFGASLSTLLQSAAPDDYRGRIFGAYGTTFALLTLCGMGLASTAGDLVGIVPVINIQGAGFVIAGLLALVLIPRVLSRGMALAGSPAIIEPQTPGDAVAGEVSTGGDVHTY